MSEDILEEFFVILNSAGDSNKLQKGLLRLKNGTPKTFRSFIKKFDDAQSGLSISWSSPSKPGKGGFARLRRSEIEAAIESIDEVDSEDYEIIELDDVKLISANDETKSFIIRDMSIKDKKKSKLKGYISKEALALADQNNESLEIGKKYRVRLLIGLNNLAIQITNTHSNQVRLDQPPKFIFALTEGGFRSFPFNLAGRFEATDHNFIDNQARQQSTGYCGTARPNP